MRIILFFLFCLIALTGFLGIVFPKIPGLLFLWGGTTLVAALGGSRTIGWPLFAFLTAITFTIHSYTNHLDRRQRAKYGRYGYVLLNTLIGSIATLLFFGVLFGPAVGLAGWELFIRRRIELTFAKSLPLALELTKGTLLEIANGILVVALLLSRLI